MRCVCVRGCVCVRDGGGGVPDLRPKFVVTQSIVFREFVIFFGGESFFAHLFWRSHTFPCLSHTFPCLSHIFSCLSHFLFGGVIHFLV